MIRGKELNESMVEPITQNRPMHSESQKKLLQRELDESQLVTPKRPKVINEPGSHAESEGATPNDMPMFERVPPQVNTRTDDEVP
jgi:hypothetical protein